MFIIWYFLIYTNGYKERERIGYIPLYAVLRIDFPDDTFKITLIGWKPQTVVHKDDSAVLSAIYCVYSALIKPFQSETPQRCVRHSELVHIKSHSIAFILADKNPSGASIVKGVQQPVICAKGYSIAKALIHFNLFFDFFAFTITKFCQI